MNWQNYPPARLGRQLQDSDSVNCPANVITQLIASTTQKSRWVQIRINGVLLDGSLGILYGAAGFEVQRLHWFFGAGTNWDICNMAFEIPRLTRVSARPTVNITSVELHIYF